MLFLVDIVLKQRRTKTSITFKVQNAINISRSFVILGNNRFTRFLTLSRQRIDDDVINKNSIKDKMHFHRREKLEFDDQKILFKNAFYFKEFNVTIVQLDCRTSDVKILSVKLDFVIHEVFKTRTTRTINIELINSLSDKHFITQMLNKFFHFLDKTFDINQLSSSLSYKIKRQKI